jgi:hypothetical protein
MPGVSFRSIEAAGKAESTPRTRAARNDGRPSAFGSRKPEDPYSLYFDHHLMVSLMSFIHDVISDVRE